MKELYSKRLYIRPLVQADLDECSELLTDDFDYYYGPFKEDREDVVARLDWLVKLTNWKYAGSLYGDRAIIRQENNALIGLCGIDPWVWRYTKKQQYPSLFPDPNDLATTSIEFELGYALKEAYRGKGYATEAVQCLIDFAFNEAKISRILARTEIANVRSTAMMRRVGMETVVNPEWGGVGAMIRNPHHE